MPPIKAPFLFCKGLQNMAEEEDKMNPIDFYSSRAWIVTSPYGVRIDPITKKAGVFHHGIDFGGKPAGAPVETAYAGTVRAAGYYGTAGNAVSVKSAKTG